MSSVAPSQRLFPIKAVYPTMSVNIMAAMDYLDKVVRDIEGCMVHAGTAGRNSGGTVVVRGDSRILIKRPDVGTAPNLYSIQSRQELQSEIQRLRNRVNQLEGDVRQLRASGGVVNTGRREAPQIIYPNNYQQFNEYPRQIPCRWTLVPGAVSYNMEVMSQYNGKWNPWATYTNIVGTSKTIGFVGAQPGAWQVYAVYADGTYGPKSEWGTFECLR